MKTHVLALLAAMASCVAAQADGNAPGNTPQDRLGTITNALKNVTDATGNLANVLRAFTGSELRDLLDGSSGVQDAIDLAIEAVGEVDPPLDIIGALFLAHPTEDLGDKVGESINLLIEKKPVFDENNLSEVVLVQLKQQQNGSTALVNAIKGKIPVEAGPIADRLASPAVDALNRGLATFDPEYSGPPVTGGAMSRSGAGFGVAALAAGVAAAMLLL